MLRHLPVGVSGVFIINSLVFDREPSVWDRYRCSRYRRCFMLSSNIGPMQASSDGSWRRDVSHGPAEYPRKALDMQGGECVRGRGACIERYREQLLCIIPAISAISAHRCASKLAETFTSSAREIVENEPFVSLPHLRLVDFILQSACCTVRVGKSEHDTSSHQAQQSECIHSPFIRSQASSLA